jgi:hypothetical protein
MPFLPGHFIAYALVYCLVGSPCQIAGWDPLSYEMPPYKLEADCLAEASRRGSDGTHQWVCRQVPAQASWTLR